MGTIVGSRCKSGGGRESDGVREYGGDDGCGCERYRECQSGGVREYGSVCVHDPCVTCTRVRRG